MKLYGRTSPWRKSDNRGVLSGSPRPATSSRTDHAQRALLRAQRLAHLSKNCIPGLEQGTKVPAHFICSRRSCDLSPQNTLLMTLLVSKPANMNTTPNREKADKLVIGADTVASGEMVFCACSLRLEPDSSHPRLLARRQHDGVTDGEEALVRVSDARLSCLFRILVFFPLLVLLGSFSCFKLPSGISKKKAEEAGEHAPKLLLQPLSWGHFLRRQCPGRSIFLSRAPRLILTIVGRRATKRDQKELRKR